MSPTRITPLPQARRVGVVVLLGACLLAAACSSNNTASTTTSTTTTTAPPSSSLKSFAIDTPDGQLSLSLDGNLPPNWPKSFPLPNGATPAGSGSLGGTSKTVMVAAFTSPATAQDAFDFYKNDSGLTITDSSSFGIGERYVGTLKLGGSYTRRVNIVSRNNQTLIVTVLETAGAGTGTTAGTTPGSTPASVSATKVTKPDATKPGTTKP